MVISFTSIMSVSVERLRPTWKRESKLIGQEGTKKICSSWLAVLNLKFVITVRKVIMNPPFVHHRSMFLQFQQLRRLSLIRGQLSMTQGLTDKAVLKWHILVQKFATTSMLKVVISKFVISSIFVRSVNHLIMGSPNVSLRNQKPQLHTCEPLLLDMREIWFSFQGDWDLHQGDYLLAFLMRRFKLFSIKLERNFKKYMNYSTLCFKFTLKLTKISTKYIKTEKFQYN